MGAGYHTIHHTAYKFNYGHWTTVMDAWYGTLLSPEDYPAWLKLRGKEISKDAPAQKLVNVNANAS